MSFRDVFAGGRRVWSMRHKLRPKTGELSEARGVIEAALRAVDQHLPDWDDSLSVALGWSDDPVVADRYGGAVSTCPGPTRVTVLFHAETVGWSDSLYAAVTRGCGRAWLVGELPDERVRFRWQAVLQEAVGLSIATEIVSDHGGPWPDASELAESWPELRTGMDRSLDPLEKDSVESPWTTIPDITTGLGAILADSQSPNKISNMTCSEVIAELDNTLGAS